MKFLIMQISPTSCHFTPLQSKYSPQQLVQDTLSLYSGLNVKDQEASHPNRTTGKIDENYREIDF
jgi:hypothetical protein